MKSERFQLQKSFYITYNGAVAVLDRGSSVFRDNAHHKSEKNVKIVCDELTEFKKCGQMEAKRGHMFELNGIYYDVYVDENWAQMAENRP